MRTLVPLFLAARGGSAINPCAAPIALQWGTASDEAAHSLVAARSGAVFVAGRLSPLRPGAGGAGRLKRRPHGIRVRAFGGPKA